MERFYLKSFGCKVSQYDGQGLRERFLDAGLTETKVPEEADLLAVNFCVVTGRSASRCFRFMKGLARRQLSARLVVSGCLSPGDRDKVKAACPDALVIDRINEPGEIEALLPQGTPAEPWQQVQGLEGHTRAFVKVQDGCNLKCTYCIIPSIRGREKSRPASEVVDEVARLIDKGYRELVLCGIRLGGYRFESMRLDGLVDAILNRVPGSYRIRLSSLNPAEVTPGLLEVMASDPRVAQHLHLPLQSGDPAVLKQMKRPYSPERFLQKVEELRKHLSHPAVSTDLLVGFPGEDEAAFLQSLDVLDRAGVSRVHVFPYSIREGTPAAGMKQVPDFEKTRRARIAQERAAQLKERFDRSCLGTIDEVLIESVGQKENGLPVGLTSRYQKTAITGLEPVDTVETPSGLSPGAPSGFPAGTFVKVRLEDYDNGVFKGSACKEDENGS